MKNRTRSIILISLGVVLMATGVFGYQSRVAIREWWEQRFAEPLPPETNRNQIVKNQNSASNQNQNQNQNTNAAPAPLPLEANLKVPFTSQAPDANWDQDHSEFCEEASTLMVGRYWQDRTIDGPADAEAALQQIKTFELQELGFYYDSTAAETAVILEKLYNLKVELVENPTLDDIKRAIADGKPVLVPAAGRELGNPNYRSPGPVYHMLVLKGYTKDGKLITNDAGTRKGADYVYDASVVMKAMHDWVPAGDRTKPANGSATGKKIMIVASQI